MRLAYLCNLYPAVSHSFVRREIEGVEQLGHEVHRFSLRPAHSDLKDAADLREAEITQSVLPQGMPRLLLAALAISMGRPIKTLTSMGAAWRLSGPGLKAKVRHVAYWLEAAWLVRRMDQLRVEHLHCHFGTNPAAVAAIAKAWGGPPFSFTVHGPDEFDEPVALSLAKKVKAAQFVAAISSYGRSQLMRWSEPAFWSKIKVIRCGVDSEYLDSQPQFVPPDSTEFVCVARLSAQKGLPLLIEACDRLHQARQQFTLTIIGDGELRDELENEIRSRGLTDRVRLVGTKSAAEIREHLRSARAFVLPSFAEGLPVVLMEALAMSRPAITTAIAGIPELVDEQCGWVVPAGDEVALAEAMINVLAASPADLDAKGSVGRERARRLHNARINAAEIVQAIEAQKACPNAA